MGGSFYGKMIEGLYRLPANAQEWIKGMQGMFNEAVRNNPWALRFIPDHFKTEDMRIKAFEADPWLLKDVPDDSKAQKVCDDAVRDYLFTLEFVLDWFVTHQQIKI